MMALKIVMENIIITKHLNQNNMTAVEWLVEKLEIFATEEEMNIIEQAKEMEKQQIMKAVYDSMGTNIDPNLGRAEQYYNEIYNK